MLEIELRSSGGLDIAFNQFIYAFLKQKLIMPKFSKNFMSLPFSLLTSESIGMCHTPGHEFSKHINLYKINFKISHTSKLKMNMFHSCI